MTLMKQKVAIPFSEGMQTKTDERQQAIGSFRLIKNAVFDKIGKLLKRNGYDFISGKKTNDTDITSAKKLSKFQDELILFDSTNLYSRIDSLEKWSDKSTVFTIHPETKQVIKNNKAQSNVDSAHLNGLNCFVYEDSDGVHLSIIDTVSGGFVLAKETLAASGTNPKIRVREGEAYCFYEESAAIKYRKFLNFNNIDAAATMTGVTLHASNDHYDVALTNDKLSIVFNNASAQLSFVQLSEADVVSSVTNLTAENPANGLNATADADGNLLCSYATSTDVKFVSYDSRLNVKKVTETSVETISNVVNMTTAQTADDTYTVIYEISDTNTYDHYLKKNTIDTSASTGTAAVLLRSVGLASKPFDYNSTDYITVIHDNTLQSTYFVADLSGNLYSKIFGGTGGDVISAGGLPQVDSITSSKFLMAQQSKGRLVEDNGTFYSLLGVSSVCLDVLPSPQYQSKELGKNLHISGGYLKAYDGSEVTEHGFHLYPEGLANGGTSTSGGVLSDGTYEYKAVYAWTDAQGIVHRSAPSEAISITLSGGGSTQQQTVDVPTLRLTEKSNVIIELYRTEDSGTVFYKVTSTSSPTFNDKTANTVSIADTLINDASLISQELLYTTGGVLENISAPASSIIAEYKDRIVVMTEESDKFNYSKTVREGFPVEFNDALELQVPKTGGGNNVQLIQMDDKLIIFKELSIQYTSGDGPNNLGEQDTFIKPELIMSGIGCKSADSVLLTPKGVIFQSNKGMYLLDPSLNLTYIGDELEEFNDLTVSSAEMVSGKNQARFTTSDGECFVYNYYRDKWGVFGNHKALSAVVLGNDYYYVRSDNVVYKESENFDDYGSPNTFEFESAWMSFAGVQGYQRVYRMLINGKYKSPHKLLVQIAYDNVDAWVDETIIDSSSFIAGETYGADSPYGETDSVYGGLGDEYVMRIDLARQRCSSIKIRIKEIQETAGEGLEISNVLFVVGVRNTEHKVDSDNQFGVS